MHLDFSVIIMTESGLDDQGSILSSDREVSVGLHVHAGSVAHSRVL